MYPITYEKMSECIRFRKSVANCSRCGGTGKYSTVANNTAGTYGKHCFQCGSAYKLPKKWAKMTPKDIADLIPFSHCRLNLIKFLLQLLDVNILTERQYQAVIAEIESR